MAISSADIVNRAIQFNGGFNNNGPVVGNPPAFDGSEYGKAAGQLYNAVVQTVGRQFGWDFSRNDATLTASGGTPPPDWNFEYLYPTNGIQVRQVLPPTIDPNNPIPTRWTVGYNTIGQQPVKVIWTDVAVTKAYISGQPPESLWDSLFTETVVRLLASELALAVPAKPDSSQTIITQAETFEQIGESRDA